jgi:hypothetical protein
MKKILLMLGMTVMTILLSCTKEEEKKTEEGTVFTVSFVDAMCGSVILSIEDEKYYDLGEKGFIHKGVKYASVFLTTAPCKLPSINAFNTATADRKPFKVRITDKPPVGDSGCVTCMALFSPSPNKSYFIEVLP